MSIHTYRAKSLPEALALVRRDLGPDASVLHTREVGGLFGWLSSSRLIEVSASNTVKVPSRLPAELDSEVLATPAPARPAGRGKPARLPPAHEQNFTEEFRRDLADDLEDDGDSLVEELCRDEVELDLPLDSSPIDSDTSGHIASADDSDIFSRLGRDLAAAEVPEDFARELLLRLRVSLGKDAANDPAAAKLRLARLLEDRLRPCQQIRLTPGNRRLVALVGPTGVGKTTTVAKLAANFRLREKRSVGLITVDTYRIAAVDQLRTYADIIDLPMEVVDSPRQMRSAIARLGKLDLILLDTAGRSPRDAEQLLALKLILAEAQPDEIHLVLSAAAVNQGLAGAAEKFISVGASALVLSKLDEATSLGGLLPLLCRSQLPLSYLTHGQNVPDDIRSADRGAFVRLALEMETLHA